MDFFDKYLNNLRFGVDLLQILAYTISYIIIGISIVRSSYIYFIYYNKSVELSYDKIRIVLGESSSLALSFILGVELLKIFYIKTYKQLIFVICLVLLKLLVTRFLSSEIQNISRQQERD